MPTKAEFRSELRRQLREAELRRAQHLEVNAGDLHRKLGGYPGLSQRLPSCCDVMYDEQKAGDEIVSRPAKGKGASLTIRYKLPRPHENQFSARSDVDDNVSVNGAQEVSATTDWYWEGNVVDAVESYLLRRGWQIVSKANTHSKERGIDIHAAKDAITLLIEAKGYPSKQYRDPNRAGAQKPTSPTNQAQHWFSHALLKSMRLQTKYKNAIVALAFPDFPRYRTLHLETRAGLETLGVALFFVKENGDIEPWGI